MLSSTKLSVALRADYLTQLQQLGTTLTLAAGETLFDVHSSSGEMHVIVQGDINLYKAGQDLPVIWLGPGDILGEIGFILRTPRTTTARAGTQGCILWRLDRRVISPRMDAEIMGLLTRLFVGMAPYVRVRYAKLTGGYGHSFRTLGQHCDHEHSAIQHMAEFLIGYDSWETVQNIWEYIRFLPYRFGFWNLLASQVLQMGYGMCTTKTNLQVALLRACGVEAAFGEIDFPSERMKPLVPEGYHHILAIEPHVKHYFAVFRIGGEWYPCDATYPPQIWELLAPGQPERPFEAGTPYNPCNEMIGKTASAYTRYDTLDHVLKKRPFYDADNVEAMNIILDKVQGPFLMIPEWVVPIHYLMQQAPRAAFQRAYAGIVTEMERLYRAVMVSTGEAEAPRDTGRVAVL
jgi:CRP-like cAMP-binding protein